MLRKGDLTQGGITGTLLHFTLPMMVGSFLQQCYNIADTLIVGQCIGAGALAAVGSAYTLMVFLISVLLGLAMGSGTVFSLHYGAGNHVALRRSIFSSFVLIGIVTLILNVAVFIWLDPILRSVATEDRSVCISGQVSCPRVAAACFEYCRMPFHYIPFWIAVRTFLDPAV